jgi:2-amino-4-hydroxy-6-hydroxymethyldihydropteridine diphosphokinase
MILIALGASLSSAAGPPEATLPAALGNLAGRGVKLEKQSRLYRSAAWPDPADPPFVNAVARVSTGLSPAELLHALHGVEAEFGRVRASANAPRTLDLDLIDYDGRVEDGPPQLPHPRMESRRFVLVPLQDVAPDWHHPISGKSVADLIAEAPPAEIVPISRRG